MPRQPSPDDPGRFTYGGLDRTLHERARLEIMICLATYSDGVRFGDLKRLCALTDGNLSRHLEVLNEAGIVEIWKGFEKRRPQTLCRLSGRGRQRFRTYVDELARVLRDASAAARRRAPVRTAMPGGWRRVEGAGRLNGGR
jgi:DNA-binding transcriptional ArsR family regulator